MSNILGRAQAQFPSVLLTLISIIQALALELLWSEITGSSYLWELTYDSVVAWAMISATLLGILQIWVTYTTLVMGFTWVPSLRDSIFPFVIGIQEFMLVTMISDDFSGTWLYVLASIFVTANWVTQISLRRTRREPENSQFFDGRERATLRDFRWAIAIIGILTAFGIWVDIAGNTSWLPIVAVAFANVVIILQVFSSSRLWKVLMKLPDSP